MVPSPISAIKWQDPTLKTYFVEDHARVPTPTTEASSPSSAGASSFSTPSSPNKGAIAGSVVGGVAGFATVAVISWFFLRRRRRTQQVTTEAEANPCGGESCYNGQPSEMAATPYRMELHGGRGGAEAWEMDGSVRHVERDHHTQPRQEIDGTMVG